MAKSNERRMSILAHYGILGRPGSSVPKAKRKILEEALEGSTNRPGIKDIEKYRETNKGTTSVQEDVQKVTGKRPSSTWDEAIKERARKAMAAMRAASKKR